MEDRPGRAAGGEPPGGTAAEGERPSGTAAEGEHRRASRHLLGGLERPALIPVTVYDVVGGLAVVGMLALLLGRAAGNLRRLAKLEPPATRRS